MAKVEQTSKEYFRTLTIMSITLILGQILFGLVAFFLMRNQVTIDKQSQLYQLSIYLIPAIAIVGLFTGFKFFQYKLKSLKEEVDLKIKMSNYRKLLLTRYGLIELPSFFAIIAVILTGMMTFFMIPVLIVGIMIYIQPNRDKIISVLELNPNEIAIVENPDAIIAEIERVNN